MPLFRLLCLLFFVISLDARSQSNPFVQNYSHEYAFDSPHMLTDVQTSANGDLYIVTLGEVTRFDSKTFQIIEGALNDRGAFYRFYENDQGEKYIVDHLGKVYHIRNNRIEPYAFNDSLALISRAKLFVDVHFDAQRKLHISYSNNQYITVDSNGQITRPLDELEEKINGVSCSFLSNGHPFMAQKFSKDRSLPLFFHLIDNQGRIIEKVEIPRSPKLSHNEITQLRDGSYLYFSGYGHLIQFDSTGIIKQITTDSPIIDLFVSADGGLWVSHDDGMGVHYYPSGFYGVGPYQTLFEGSDSQVSAQDFQGGLWAFERNLGLNRIFNKGLIHHTPKAGMAKGMLARSVELNGDSLYIGGQRGTLRLINRQAGTSTDFVLPNSKKAIYSLCQPAGENRVWLGARRGLYQFEGERIRPMFQKVLDSLGLGQIAYISPQPNNDSVSAAVVLGYHYLFLKDTAITRVSRAFPTKLRKVLVNGDSTWIVSDAGLLLETRDTLIDFSRSDSLMKSRVFNVVRFNGKTFISVGFKGVYYFEEGTFKQLKLMGEKTINCDFARLNDSVMWVLSSQANFKLSLNPSKTDSPYRIEAFSRLPKKLLIRSHHFDNQTYIGCISNGDLIECSFTDLEQKPVSNVQLRLMEITVNNTAKSLTDSIFHLSPDENNISIEFLGLAYENRPIHYEYQLKGNQKGWTKTDENLQLVSLPPGKYEIEIRAKTPTQPWSATKSLTFHIAPHFWQRWWFITLVVLAISGAGFSSAFLRNRILNREKVLTIQRLSAEQKALRAKMDPHFVFNIVASVQYLISSRNNEKAALFLNKFAAIMRNTLDQTSRETNSIASEVQFLTEYIELEQLRLEDKFDYTLKVAPDIDQKREIPNFIIQPLVENAIQHGIKNKADRGHLSVELLPQGHFLQVVVEDDGLGYEATLRLQANNKKDRQSHGLQTIRDRLLLHNGKTNLTPIAIENRTDGTQPLPGTRVTLSIRLK